MSQISTAPGEFPSSISGARSFVAELIAENSPGGTIDAQGILAGRPDLAENRSVVVDLAFEEYCRRTDAGEELAPQEFAQRFPRFEQSILKVIEVHRYFQKDGNWQEPFASPDQLQVGEEFLGFHLLAELGRGAFSRVFLAREQEVGNRYVVVKACGQDGDEADRLGQLAHANIIPIHSVRHDFQSGLTAICMPYFGNATLLNVIDEEFGDSAAGPASSGAILSAARRCIDQDLAEIPNRPPHWALQNRTYAEGVAAIAVQLCDALAYTHGKGISHCDIKPSNVLLTESGCPLLLDFNLSVQRDAVGNRVGGTLPYMAPEQLQRLAADHPPRDASAIGPHSDVFSLGVVLYQLLTGEHPFGPIDLDKPRQLAAKKLLKRQRNAASALARLKQQAGEPLADIIGRCFAIDPADRPSAAALAEEFRRHLSMPARLRRWLKRHQRTVCLAAGLLLCLLAAGAIAAAMRPPLHVSAYESGYAGLASGNYTAAATHFSRALTSDPDFEQARFARGWARLRASQQPGVDEKTKEHLVNDAYRDFRSYYDFVEASKPVDSVDAMTADYINWREKMATAAASLAYCESFMTEGEALARIHYQEAIAHDLGTANILNNYGNLLVSSKNLTTAATVLENALRLQPDLRSAQLNLAYVELRLVRGTGTPDDQTHMTLAVKWIEQARRDPPVSSEVEWAAAWIYAVAHKYFRDDELLNLRDAQRNSASNTSPFAERAAAACLRAVEHGLPLAKLSAPYSAWPELQAIVENDVRYKNLIQQSPSAITPPPTIRRRDIYPDIQQRLLLPADRR